MRGVGTAQIQGRKRLRVGEGGHQRSDGFVIMAGRKRPGAILIMLVPLRAFLCRQKQRRKKNYEDTPTAETPHMSHMLPLKLSGIRRRSRDCSDEVARQ